MASQTGCIGAAAKKPDLFRAFFQGFSLVLNAADEAEADRLFAVLSEGGHVQMPLSKTFFSPRFGMVADRFGVSWMIIVE